MDGLGMVQDLTLLVLIGELWSYIAFLQKHNSWQRTFLWGLAQSMGDIATRIVNEWTRVSSQYCGPTTIEEHTG